jgi:hypothetical protein
MFVHLERPNYSYRTIEHFIETVISNMGLELLNTKVLKALAFGLVYFGVPKDLTRF